MTDRDEKVREAKVLAEMLPVHVMRLANTNMGISMMDWDEISNDILAAARALAALSHPAPDVPGAEEVEAIRARHEAAKQALDDERYYSGNVPAVFPTNEGKRAHADRATLLRLLDAARAELAKVKKAAGPFVETLKHDISEDETMNDYFRPIEKYNHAPRLTVGDFRRLAAALKEKP
jgi:hypothetical protein